jgi:hypothetical protein
MSWNKLKNLSATDLEKIIGEAVSKTMNDTHGCSVSEIKYNTL